MIVEPKTRGFICTTAHPTGCFENVRREVEYVKSQPHVDGPKRALVIGASTGYGLASRIVSAFSCGAATLGIIFDKPAKGPRTASAGWYNTAAFEKLAAADGLYAKTINGDAFSKEVKDQAIEMIRRDLGTIDLLVYSLAAPRRTMPDGTTVSSVLKTTGDPFTNKTIDLKTRSISEVTVEPATDEEVRDTVHVMGGEDWKDWIAALHDAGVLAPNTVTVAYSYIGPELTHPIYLNGSIGMAKRDLYNKSVEITKEFPEVSAYISVNKALVTQASAAIPVVPLYISLLYKSMKERGLHEGCIEQMYRLYHEKLFPAGQPETDSEGRIRMDDWEMKPEIQQEISDLWTRLDDNVVRDHADIDGYWEDFYQMFGFQIPGVDYTKDVDTEVAIPSIGE